jgi:glycosyltransferase involved in cell wall biosynthesis
MILVNALGCKESGARLISRRLCAEYRGDEKLVVIVANSTSDYEYGDQVKLISLSHVVFGRYLRPLYELAIYLLSFLPITSAVVNLSNYGWCYGPKHMVYFQNSNLLKGRDTQLRTGRANFFNRFLLRSCAKNARKIVVQTAIVKGEFEAMFGNDLRAPIEVCLPRVVVPPGDGNGHRHFEFQGFYPTSTLAYKRNDLAVGSQQYLTDEMGLVITIEEETPSPANIYKAGVLEREEVYQYYAGSDYLLFTSEVESLGLPLLEALSIGKPAVLPDVEYCREIYQEAAVYFPVFEARAIADAIQELRANYEHYSAAATARYTVLKLTQKSWEDHWTIFLPNSE